MFILQQKMAILFKHLYEYNLIRSLIFKAPKNAEHISLE